MKYLILILSLLVLNSTLSSAQLQQDGMTFSLPSTASKVPGQDLPTYDIAYSRFAHLPNIYKINHQVWIGFGAVKNTTVIRDSLQSHKISQDYDMNHDLKTSGIYYSKIETINNVDVYFEYHFTKGIGYYGGDLGTIYMSVFDYDKKKMFSGRVVFQNESDSTEAMNVFYDFVKSVKFVSYVNTEQSLSFTKNCGTRGVSSVVFYTAKAGAFTSGFSQDDADAKAVEDIKKNGQNYANDNCTCTFRNIAKAGIYTKYCGTGGIGSSVTYSVPAGSYTSLISEADADNMAAEDVKRNGQNYANAKGTCTFISKGSQAPKTK